MRGVLIALLVILAAGCARNAVLELDVQLPPTGVSHAELSVLSDPTGDADPRWDTVAAEPLDEIGEVARVQIVAEADSIEAPLGMRVRLCDAELCAEDAPEVRVLIDRAFYVGERTWLTLTIPAVPNTVQELDVDRCSVGGCLDGETLDFCRSDGTHYCE